VTGGGGIAAAPTNARICLCPRRRAVAGPCAAGTGSSAPGAGTSRKWWPASCINKYYFYYCNYLLTYFYRFFLISYYRLLYRYWFYFILIL
jgi:hypothetical protein